MPLLAGGQGVSMLCSKGSFGYFTMQMLTRFLAFSWNG